MKTVWIYTNTNAKFVSPKYLEKVGSSELLKVFATKATAQKWLDKNDPEGVAFEYEVKEN